VPRVVVWFSCGAASAYATFLAKEKYGDINAVYCRVRNEHPDNMLFLKEFQRKTNIHIDVIENKKYKGDIFNVFRERKYIKSPRYGAPCTMFLKRQMRHNYQRPDDIQIFGFPKGEEDRVDKLLDNEPDLKLDDILIDNNITKKDCTDWLTTQGYTMPTMYSLGYSNNNCVGCVKGSMGYWNAIRKDFPEEFNRMAKLERELNFSINKDKNGRVFLDELEPNRGNFKRDMPESCSFLCGYENPITNNEEIKGE